MDLKARAKKLKKDIPAVFLSLKDPETPWAAKVLVGITVVYALSPIDLIPDFIPILGYLDDIIILPGLIAVTIKIIPKHVWTKNQLLAEDLWQDGEPKKWYYAIPFVVIWLGIIFFIVRAIVKRQ